MAPVQIGPYTLPNRWILAPMAAVSEMPFRRIALELGAGLAPTELVSAQGLFRLSARTLRYLRHDPRIENPYPVQIFGGEPDAMAKAAVVAKEKGAHIIDINMGCPVPKVTRNSAGSALLCDPPRAGEIVRAIREASGLPVTVKIRSGWDDAQRDPVTIALRCEDAGAQALTLHARTRTQLFTGTANWDEIAQVVERLAIPVIGNGDIRSAEDVLAMRRHTGCAGIMVARGSFGNPWIFGQGRDLLEGRPQRPDPTVEERFATVLEHARLAVCYQGENRKTALEFRKHLGWYTRGLPGAALLRERLFRIQSMADAEAVLTAFLERGAVEAAA